VDRGGRGGAHDLDGTDDPTEVLRGLHGLRLQLPQVLRRRGEVAPWRRPLETLANFRKQQNSTKSPPGPKVTWLGETLIHAEDIRLPLGIAHDYPIDAVRDVIDFYKNSDTLIRAKSRIAGLTLRATDTDWTHGEGPVVEGRLMDLLMAATGRKSALESLSGEGVETFASHWG